MMWVYVAALLALVALATFTIFSPTINDTATERLALVVMSIGAIAEAYATVVNGQPGRFGLEMVLSFLFVAATSTMRQRGIRWFGLQVPVKQGE